MSRLPSISEDFNPRSPYGERPPFITSYIFPHTISIHAPLTGSDLVPYFLLRSQIDFNPRSPYGERPKCSAKSTQTYDFNPRSPYGERLVYS